MLNRTIKLTPAEAYSKFATSVVKPCILIRKVAVVAAVEISSCAVERPVDVDPDVAVAS
jgi:hypothetical protein